MRSMNLVLGFSHHGGIRLAEVAFLLVIVAGVWLAVAHVPQLKLPAVRTSVAGVLLAVAGLLLIVATHWGHFG
jgi:hypothetical protein